MARIRADEVAKTVAAIRALLDKHPPEERAAIESRLFLTPGYFDRQREAFTGLKATMRAMEREHYWKNNRHQPSEEDYQRDIALALEAETKTVGQIEIDRKDRGEEELNRKTLESRIARGKQYLSVIRTNEWIEANFPSAPLPDD